jgi:hypothetical protein
MRFRRRRAQLKATRRSMPPPLLGDRDHAGGSARTSHQASTIRERTRDGGRLGRGGGAGRRRLEFDGSRAGHTRPRAPACRSPATPGAGPKGTLREHQPGHRRSRAVTPPQPIPSSCAAFVPAGSRPCPRFPFRCSMVRRGSTVRVRQRALQKPRSRGLFCRIDLHLVECGAGMEPFMGAFRSKTPSANRTFLGLRYKRPGADISSSGDALWRSRARVLTGDPASLARRRQLVAVRSPHVRRGAAVDVASTRRRRLHAARVHDLRAGVQMAALARHGLNTTSCAGRGPPRGSLRRRPMHRRGDLTGSLLDGRG